ncbi:unnamed protein product [Amoebophrya sp. A25]|nr:unnamed protein product [Amoebophrya sp. A25]|eukprot:GSA25T00014563001.1
MKGQPGASTRASAGNVFPNKGKSKTSPKKGQVVLAEREGEVANMEVAATAVIPGSTETSHPSYTFEPGPRTAGDKNANYKVSYAGADVGGGKGKSGKKGTKMKIANGSRGRAEGEAADSEGAPLVTDSTSRTSTTSSKATGDRTASHTRTLGNGKNHKGTSSSSSFSTTKSKTKGQQGGMKGAGKFSRAVEGESALPISKGNRSKGKRPSFLRAEGEVADPMSAFDRTVTQEKSRGRSKIDDEVFLLPADIRERRVNEIQNGLVPQAMSSGGGPFSVIDREVQVQRYREEREKLGTGIGGARASSSTGQQHSQSQQHQGTRSSAGNRDTNAEQDPVGGFFRALGASVGAVGEALFGAAGGDEAKDKEDPSKAKSSAQEQNPHHHARRSQELQTRKAAAKQRTKEKYERIAQDPNFVGSFDDRDINSFLGGVTSAVNTPAESMAPISAIDSIVQRRAKGKGKKAKAKAKQREKKNVGAANRNTGGDDHSDASTLSSSSTSTTSMSSEGRQQRQKLKDNNYVEHAVSASGMNQHYPQIPRLTGTGKSQKRPGFRAGQKNLRQLKKKKTLAATVPSDSFHQRPGSIHASVHLDDEVGVAGFIAEDVVPSFFDYDLSVPATHSFVIQVEPTIRSMRPELMAMDDPAGAERRQNLRSKHQNDQEMAKLAGLKLPVGTTVLKPSVAVLKKNEGGSAGGALGVAGQKMLEESLAKEALVTADIFSDEASARSTFCSAHFYPDEYHETELFTFHARQHGNVALRYPAGTAGAHSGAASLSLVYMTRSELEKIASVAATAGGAGAGGTELNATTASVTTAPQLGVSDPTLLFAGETGARKRRILSGTSLLCNKEQKRSNITRNSNSKSFFGGANSSNMKKADVVDKGAANGTRTEKTTTTSSSTPTTSSTPSATATTKSGSLDEYPSSSKSTSTTTVPVKSGGNNLHNIAMNKNIRAEGEAAASPSVTSAATKRVTFNTSAVSDGKKEQGAVNDPPSPAKERCSRSSSIEDRINDSRKSSKSSSSCASSILSKKNTEIGDEVARQFTLLRKSAATQEDIAKDFPFAFPDHFAVLWGQEVVARFVEGEGTRGFRSSTSSTSSSSSKTKSSTRGSSPPGSRGSTDSYGTQTSSSSRSSNGSGKNSAGFRTSFLDNLTLCDVADGKPMFKLASLNWNKKLAHYHAREGSACRFLVPCVASCQSDTPEQIENKRQESAWLFTASIVEVSTGGADERRKGGAAWNAKVVRTIGRLLVTAPELEDAFDVDGSANTSAVSNVVDGSMLYSSAREDAVSSGSSLKHLPREESSAFVGVSKVDRLNELLDQHRDEDAERAWAESDASGEVSTTTSAMGLGPAAVKTDPAELKRTTVLGEEAVSLLLDELGFMDQRVLDELPVALQRRRKIKVYQTGGFEVYVDLESYEGASKVACTAFALYILQVVQWMH